MSRSAPPIIRLARLGRGRAEGAGEGGFGARFKILLLLRKDTKIMQSFPVRESIQEPALRLPKGEGLAITSRSQPTRVLCRLLLVSSRAKPRDPGSFSTPADAPAIADQARRVTLDLQHRPYVIQSEAKPSPLGANRRLNPVPKYNSRSDVPLASSP